MTERMGLTGQPPDDEPVALTVDPRGYVREARRLVGRAIRAGRLVRGECERGPHGCGGRIEGHHDDYRRPLDVRWLCVNHHREEHHHDR
jgi:hypothetical protein